MRPRRESENKIILLKTNILLKIFIKCSEYVTYAIIKDIIHFANTNIIVGKIINSDQ